MQYFRLAKPIGKDGTLRDLLLAQERLDGRPNQDIDLGIIPPYATELWTFYLLLHSCRGSGVQGVEPITPERIESLARMYRVRLNPWEVETLLLMDAKLLASAAAAKTQQEPEAKA